MRIRTGTSEEALMEAYVEGDVGAFQRLFESLAPALRAFFVRSVGDGGVSDDLTQTTFLKLHGARRLWRRGERLRPWVFSIAAHVRADWLRRQGRTAREALDEEQLADPEPSSDPRTVLGDRERRERVRAALDALSAPQRMVVHLHRFEGLSFAEIGRILGITEGAAKLRAFRAYEELRKRLRDLVVEESS
jgi:RNA polymerase sigma-70 factor (ECF subfamily)